MTNKIPMARVAGDVHVNLEKSTARLIFSHPSSAGQALASVKKYFPDAEMETVVGANSSELEIKFHAYTLDGPVAVKRLHNFLMGIHVGWMLLSKVPPPVPETYFCVTTLQNKEGRSTEVHRFVDRRVEAKEGAAFAAIDAQQMNLNQSKQRWRAIVVEFYDSANAWALKQKPIMSYSPT